MNADVVAEALAVAALGAEADKTESLEVILSRLDASKHETLLPGQCSEVFDSSAFAVARTSQRTRRTGGLAQHPKPFSPARTTGGAFLGAGHLPHRDLTSWEQQKAIMPERSWSQSAMTCVMRSGLSMSAPSSPLRTRGAQTHSQGMFARSPARADDFLESDERMQRFSATSAQIQKGASYAPISGLRKGPAATMSRAALTSQHGPSAGGPFAGRRAVHDRSSAASAWRTKADAAASSYNYLGPAADGPPLPTIHPLWS
ncbi:unnamed protein product [Symbiodinium pilosum]|uniref:Uncharacterized protein n=1 Tax=Symbiodinium pilosum TaxID=2952 RepID=A0A812KAF2_SYMPI|nr:unnamed protein product [Symbiodinium pilosum]